MAVLNTKPNAPTPAQPSKLVLNLESCATGAFQGPSEAATAAGGEPGAHVGAQIPPAGQVVGLAPPAAPIGAVPRVGQSPRQWRRRLRHSSGSAQWSRQE